MRASKYILVLALAAIAAWPHFRAGASEPPGDHLSPIALAVWEGDIASTVSLIRADAKNLEDRSFAGQTPLIITSGKGHVDLTWLLIKLGADVNARDLGGASALCFGARSPEHEVTEMLLHAGADVRAQDKDGSTALAYAVAGGQVQNARLLTRAGADPNAADRKGRTPMSLARAITDANLRDKLVTALGEEASGSETRHE